MRRRFGIVFLSLGAVTALAACGSPASGGGASGTGQAGSPSATSIGATSRFTVDGFSYTVAAGPIQKSIGQGAGAAPPGYHWWSMQVTVHNVQTDRDAPLQPAYTDITSVGPPTNCPNLSIHTCAVDLSATEPSDVSQAYFNPGQTVQITYGSGWPLSDTLSSPSSYTWNFVTQNNYPLANKSVRLDVRTPADGGSGSGQLSFADKQQLVDQAASNAATDLSSLKGTNFSSDLDSVSGEVQDAQAMLGSAQTNMQDLQIDMGHGSVCSPAAGIADNVYSASDIVSSLVTDTQQLEKDIATVKQLIQTAQNDVAAYQKAKARLPNYTPMTRVGNLNSAISTAQGAINAAVSQANRSISQVDSAVAQAYQLANQASQANQQGGCGPLTINPQPAPLQPLHA